MEIAYEALEEAMRRDEALAILRQHLPLLAAHYRIKQMVLFGSTARDEARPDSDVDLLVEFEEAPTFDRYMELKFTLEELLHAPVDLGSWKTLKARLRPLVEQESILVA